MQPGRTTSRGPVKFCKKAKVTISFAFCFISHGSDKRTATANGKSTKPCCFKHYDPYIYINYVHNIKALMTTKEYKEWLSGFYKKKRNKCTVLLL
jgi:hypothetical protein